MTEARAAMSESVSEIRECQQVHDTVWLTLLFGLVATLVLSARAGLLAARATPIVIGILVYFAFYASFKEAIRGVGDPRRLQFLLRVLHLSGPLFLGFLWLEAGGLGMPVLLMAFAIPMVTANPVMLRGQAYATALVSTAVVAGVSLAVSPGLRSHLGLPDGGPSWANAEASPYRVAVIVASFGLIQLALALSTSSVSSNFDRLILRLSASSLALERVRTLFQAVLSATPVPEVLFHVGTGRIIHSSDAFQSLVPQVTGDRPETDSFFELVSFDGANEIEEAITKRRSAAILTSYVLANRRYIGNVVLYPIRHGGDDYFHVSLREESDLYLRMAVEAMDAALVIADAEEKIMYFNQPARDLFATVRRGGPLDSILVALGLPRVYLRLLAEPRSQTFAELAGVEFVVTTSVIFRQDLGRLSLLVVREAARAGTGEIENPFRIFYAPRYFTEAASRYLGSSEPSGSFALVEFDAPDDEREELANETKFVSTVEKLLRPEDLFLGLRRRRFALLSPGDGGTDVASVLEQAKEILSSSRSSPEFVVRFSVVSISRGDDLDSLIRRAGATLPSAVREVVQ